MNTYIAYFDETGDDGTSSASCDHFILTSLYMSTESWQQNFNQMRALRKELRDKYGFHVTEEMHTKHFLTDKNPYRKYNWTPEIKREIIKAFTLTIAAMDLKIQKNTWIESDYMPGSLSPSFSLVQFFLHPL